MLEIRCLMQLVHITYQAERNLEKNSLKSNNSKVVEVSVIQLYLKIGRYLVKLFTKKAS